MKILLAVLPLFVHFAATASPAALAADCERTARVAASGMVQAAALSTKLDLKLNDVTAADVSASGTYRFAVNAGAQTYYVSVETNSSCFPVSVNWPFMDPK